MKTTKNKNLAIFHRHSEKGYFNPISLLEIMQQLEASGLVRLIYQIEELIKLLNKPPGTRLTAQEVKHFVLGLNEACCDENSLLAMGFEEASRRLAELKFAANEREGLKGIVSDRARGLIPRPTVDKLHHMLFELRLAVLNSVDAVKFLSIQPSQACFVGQKELFGKRVFKAFPSARQDIEDAGNCLGLGLHTACVFHLMRATELGMRSVVSGDISRCL